MAKVTFDGDTLMDDNEGNFGFSPGVFPEVGRDFVPMARADFLLMRELATPGCQHALELRFYGVDAQVIAERMQDAYDGGTGTLFVRSYGSYNNCVLAAAPVLGQGSYAARIDGTSVGLGFVVRLVFMQVA